MDFILSVTEYAPYYGTIPHEAGGRPKKGTRAAIIQRLAEGKDLPGVTRVARLGNMYTLYVNKETYYNAKKIIEESAK